MKRKIQSKVEDLEWEIEDLERRLSNHRFMSIILLSATIALVILIVLITSALQTLEIENNLLKANMQTWTLEISCNDYGAGVIAVESKITFDDYNLYQEALEDLADTCEVVN